MMQQQNSLRTICQEVGLVVVNRNACAVEIAIKRQSGNAARQIEAGIRGVVSAGSDRVNYSTEPTTLRQDAIVELRIRRRQTELRSIDGNDHHVGVVKHR